MVQEIAAACDGKGTLPPAKERDSNEVVTITLHAHEDKINLAEQIVMDIARAHDADQHRTLCAPATGAPKTAKAFKMDLAQFPSLPGSARTRAAFGTASASSTTASRTTCTASARTAPTAIPCKDLCNVY